MLLSVIFLLIGFFLLIKGADIFVEGASVIALHFKVPKMLIGLTIVAFGTSAPEFAVSINAFANQRADIVFGNVIGSCILNILLILGIAAILRPIKINDNTIYKEIPLCLLISTVLEITFLDQLFNQQFINQITRADGLIILLFFTIFIYYLVTLAKQKKEGNEKISPLSLGKSSFYLIIGLIGIIYGSDLVIDHATNIATLLGVDERIISLTIVAFGTSLPELVTTIISSKKGEQDLLMGNILGSNIFNICVVLGIPVIIFGTLIPCHFQIIDLLMLLISPFLLFIFSKTNRTISKIEGFMMMILFLLYYAFLFII